LLILSSATINNSKTVTAINNKAEEIFITPANELNLAKVVGSDDDSTGTKDQATIVDTTKKSDIIFASVEQLPEFPGGIEGFVKFLNSNIQYPKAAKDNNIQGRVICTFIVEKDGALSGTKVVKSVGYGIDEESVRVLNLSPKWKPGIQNHRKVRVQYSVPINFTLAGADKRVSENSIRDTSKPDKVYDAVEQLPGFPGGIEALGKFLASNIKYPKTAREKGIQGRVICSFVIETDGSLSNIIVARGVSKELDEEAIRVLKQSPSWIPGTQNGRKVRVQYSVPISYSLADDKAPAKSTGLKTGAVISLNDKIPSYTGVEIPKDTLKGYIAGKTDYRDILLCKTSPQKTPLYILNGKVSSATAIAAIDVKTIESIAVIKDKSAIALWGNQGENGVINVKTKK
jgi:TonB family protein